MSLFVHPYVIASLAGVTYRQVRRDVARFNWEKKQKAPGQLNFFNLDQVMASYGRAWSSEDIQRAIARHNRLAAFIEE